LSSVLGGLFEDFKPLGWAVLAGGLPSIGSAFPDLGERLLERIDISRPPLGIKPRGAQPRRLMAFMEELEILIETPGEVLDAGEEAADRLEDAGIVVLAGGGIRDWLQALTHSPLEQSLMAYLQSGNLVLAAGSSAGALGGWTFEEGVYELTEAVGWLPGAVVLPGIDDPASLPEVRRILCAETRSFALGLPRDTALAIGPRGEVQVWSRAAPKLVLGKGWQA
jgi:cyanophycinase-like exopeptidase